MLSRNFVLALAATATALASADAALASCSAPVGAKAGGKTQAIARQNAIGTWSGLVANNVGDLWSSWSYARNKSVACAPYSGGYCCTATATPCNS